MIKNCILILVVGLIMLGCGDRQVRQIEQVGEDSTELTIKTYYDTIHFKFKWRDADSIPYLFGKPSKDKIAEYQRRFDSLHRTERYGFYDRIEWFRDIPHITAVNDFATLWFTNKTTPYQDDLDMILWRINEYYPLNSSTTETENFQRFSEQIDSLLSYSLGSQHCAWKEYEEALHDICDKLVVGKHGGSGAPLAYGEFFIESYEQRLISLLDYYFTLGDSNYQPTERHRLIPDKMAHRAYSDFFDVINSDYEEYSVEEKQCALKNDMRLWDKWMAERRKVSAQLPMPLKKVYDNCTNNLKRRKLIQIKSRYWGYGICSSFELDCILKKDCSDEELFSYDYQIRYDALLIK